MESNKSTSIKIELMPDGTTNRIGNKSILQKEISTFLNDWENTLCYFDDEFLVEDENGDIWILATPNKPLTVSDDDLYNEDEYLSNKDKAVIAFLNNIIDSAGDFKPDLGDVGYEDGFYSAVSKLTQLDNGRVGFKLNANLNTSVGLVSGTFEFNELGKIKANLNSSRKDEYDEKYLDEAFVEHNAHEEGFDITAIDDSDDNNSSQDYIKCTFEYRPVSIYLHTCDDKNDIEEGNYELLGESDYNGTGTNAYEVKVNNKSIFKFEIPVDYIEEEDLDLSELEGKILVREIYYWSKQHVTAFISDGDDYLPGSSYYGIAYNFNGILFGEDEENLLDELEEYIPRERETQETYTEYYQIVNGKPVQFELDE